MPDEDSKKDDIKKTGQIQGTRPKKDSVKKDDVKGGDASKPAPKKRRRRPRKKRTAKPKTDQVVPDLATVHAEAAEELDRSHDENEQFVDDQTQKAAQKEEQKAIEAASAPPPPPPPVSSEPSPFDLAASFDSGGNSSEPASEPTPQPGFEPTPASMPEAPMPESIDPAPAPPTAPKPEPATPSGPPSPFDLSPPPAPTYEPPTTPVSDPAPATPAPETPAPEPDYHAPSPFDMAAPGSSSSDPAPGASEPRPEPSPAFSSSEPSPFDLAPSAHHDEPAKKDDGFGDYQSPFGGSPKPKHDEPKLDHEPVAEPVKPESDPFSKLDEPAKEASLESEKMDPVKEPEKDIVEGEVVGEEPPQPEPVTEGSLDELAMEGSFMDRIEQLLHEANLTPRHLKFCCGSLVMIGLVIWGGFFLAPKLINGNFSFFHFGGSDKPDADEIVVQPDEDVVPVEVPDEKPPAQVPASNGGKVWVDPSIYGGLLLGDPGAELEGTTGVDTGVLVGDDTDDYSTKFQTFVADLEDTYNLYFVDVDALLDESRNRTETLDNHIKQMKEYYNLGVDHFEEIGAMKKELSTEFDENTILKEEAEAQTFAELNDFKGASSEEQLYLFIELKKVEVDLKARYYVLEKLESMYETVLTSVFTRIKDYELNREALIADVQVIDVEGSDIDLILTEFDLE